MLVHSEQSAIFLNKVFAISDYFVSFNAVAKLKTFLHLLISK